MEGTEQRESQKVEIAGEIRKDDAFYSSGE